MKTLRVLSLLTFCGAGVFVSIKWPIVATIFTVLGFAILGLMGWWAISDADDVQEFEEGEE